MSSNLNKSSIFAVILLLVSSAAVRSSAQTPAASNGLMAQGSSPDAIREPAKALLEKKAGPSAEVTDLTTSPTAEPAVTSTTPQTTPADDEWQFQITPYLFLPTISGRAGIGNLVTDTSVSIGESDVELNFAFMGTFEARKDRFIILTDFLYADIATERGNPGPLFSSSRASFKATVFDPEVGYRVLDNGNGSSLDVLGGIRYYHLNATLDFAAGILPATSASRSRSWVDGVTGLRGRAHLSPRWFVVGKADLGAGGSELTYQLFGALGVNFGKRIALVGGYRDLKVDYNKDNFLFDMSLHGPIIGLSFKL